MGSVSRVSLFVWGFSEFRVSLVAKALEAFAVWALVVSLFLLGITTITFIRFSLRNIDARMKADGVTVAWEGDRTGLRAGFSAYIIALPMKRYEGQIDVYASLRSIKPYATKADKRWAMAMIVTEFMFLASGLFFFLFGPDVD